MPEYTLDPVAENDLWEIWQFIARDNPVAASKVVVAAHKTFALVAVAPQMGKSHPELYKGTNPIRSCPVLGFKKYIVFYQTAPGGIRVLRVYHAKRNLASVLKGK